MGAVLGSFGGSFLSQKIGRKLTLTVTSMGFALGWAVLYVSTGVTLLYIGRFVTGFSTGVVSLCVPVYISEVTPPRNRSCLVSPRMRCLIISVLCYVTWF